MDENTRLELHAAYTAFCAEPQPPYTAERALLGFVVPGPVVSALFFLSARRWKRRCEARHARLSGAVADAYRLTDTHTRLLLLDALHALDRNNEARVVAEQMLSEHPRDGDSWLALSLVEERAGDLRAADAAIERAVEVEPGNSAAHTRAIALAVGLGDRGLADARARVALARLGADPNARYQAARAQMFEGRFAEAGLLFAELAEAHPAALHLLKDMTTLLKRARTKRPSRLHDLFVILPGAAIMGAAAYWGMDRPEPDDLLGVALMASLAVGGLIVWLRQRNDKAWLAVTSPELLVYEQRVKDARKPARFAADRAQLEALAEQVVRGEPLSASQEARVATIMGARESYFELLHGDHPERREAHVAMYETAVRAAATGHPEHGGWPLRSRLRMVVLPELRQRASAAEPWSLVEAILPILTDGEPEQAAQWWKALDAADPELGAMVLRWAALSGRFPELYPEESRAAFWAAVGRGDPSITQRNPA